MEMGAEAGGGVVGAAAGGAEAALFSGIPAAGTCAAEEEQCEKKIAAEISTAAMRISVPFLGD
jgi:hypothetical protein